MELPQPLPIIALDRDGMVTREASYRGIREGLGLDDPLDRLLMVHRRDYVAAIAPVRETTLDRLRRLRSEGWRIGVVTNGDSVQLDKLDAAQVAGLIDNCCVSGLVGFRKPADLIGPVDRRGA